LKTKELLLLGDTETRYVRQVAATLTAEVCELWSLCSYFSFFACGFSTQ